MTDETEAKSDIPKNSRDGNDNAADADRGKIHDISVFTIQYRITEPRFSQPGWNYLMCDLNLLDNDEQFVGSSVDRFGLDRCFQGCCWPAHMVACVICLQNEEDVFRTYSGRDRYATIAICTT